MKSVVDGRRHEAVLVVDDIAANRMLVKAHLADLGCDVIEASSGHQALALIASQQPNLVLLDVQMPDVDGFEVCHLLKANPETRLLPVVMVTALNAVEDRVRALEAGADDFLAKPVDSVELQARVRSLLRLKAVYDTLDDTEQVVFAMARAVEARDRYTEAHTARVAAAARRLGEALALGELELDVLQRGAILHDVGKIGVPDAVLLKQGPLNPSELASMRRHPVIGVEILRPLRSTQRLLEIVRSHHERYDGEGYPDGLAGEEIPLLARLVAVCDAYDALTTDRPYRKALTADAASRELRRGRESQWDPTVVDAFLGVVVASNRTLKEPA